VNRVVTTIERADPAVIAGLAEAGVATVHEAMGRRGLLDAALAPVWRGSRIAGSAVTSLNQPGDNLMCHAAIEQCRAGDVLVVAVTSPSTDGYFGELMVTSMQSRGVAGLVTDTGIRDVAEITEMGFPVWSRAISAAGTVKATAGSVNVEVVCAGQVVRPGDVVVADDDGICVVPRLDAPEVLAAARARIAKEAATRARLAAGELALDLNNLRAKLAELGVVYE
jgi:4-hydroxy-4-methyl-2-oxoglutarate aldolase